MNPGPMYELDLRMLQDQLNRVYYGTRWEKLEIVDPSRIYYDLREAEENHEGCGLSEFHPDKKLFVLDMDCTLVYHNGQLRPYLFEMLTRIYRDYNIILWTSEDSDVSLEKAQLFDLIYRDDFQIAAILAKDAMIPLDIRDGTIFVKALDLIWDKYGTGYSAKDTIIFDDNWRNYAVNEKSGISSYRSLYCEDPILDRALLEIANYMRRIRAFEDFESLNHERWMISLDPSRHAITCQGRIIGGNMTIDILSMASEVNFTLFPSCEERPPDLSPNKNGERRRTFKLETFLSTVETQSDSSLPTADLENPRVCYEQLQTNSENLILPELNPFRAGKKLVILNLDYTLCDPNIEGFPCLEAQRPYLTEFLSEIYPLYDIGIWCTRDEQWITNVLDELKITAKTNYKIAFYMTADSMIYVDSKIFGRVSVKPLQIFWQNFRNYSPKNTIAIDEIGGQFMLNPQSRLEIMRYRAQNESIDWELRKLTRYLQLIASADDFTMLNHRNWTSLESLLETHDDDTTSIPNCLTVKIEWSKNTIVLLNVPREVTIDHIKRLVCKATGYAVENQCLVVSQLYTGLSKLRPYINNSLIIDHLTGRKIIDGELLACLELQPEEEIQARDSYIAGSEIVEEVVIESDQLQQGESSQSRDSYVTEHVVQEVVIDVHEPPPAKRRKESDDEDELNSTAGG